MTFMPQFGWQLADMWCSHHKMAKEEFEKVSQQLQFTQYGKEMQ